MRDQNLDTFNEYPIGQLQEEFQDLNGDLNKSLKSFCPLVENLLEKYKKEPESFENNKVCILRVLLFHFKVTLIET
jgi:hypothetical protein